MEIPDDATGDSLRQWQSEGADLTKPMKIDFFVAVPGKEAGDRLSVDSDMTDFSVSVEQDAESGAWTCYCTIVVIPSYARVVEIEGLLKKVASRYGAHPDGFGSFGNAAA